MKYFNFVKKALRKRELPIVVKCTGGETAQLLALSNAIYLSMKFERPFRIKHYPYSTGTFRPFAIKELLERGELLEEEKDHVAKTKNLKIGSRIPDLPLRRRDQLKIKIARVLHRLNLFNIFKRLRGEVVIGGVRKNLDKVNACTLIVSGNFVPLIDVKVCAELSQRFSRSQFQNPFTSRKPNLDVVIHYRIGDMRKIPPRVPTMGGHGVVDPITFKQILNVENIDVERVVVRLVSDEPELAFNLLKGVGISSTYANKFPSIWQDLETIAQARIFIGSLSQFSMFGATLCVLTGGKPYLPLWLYEQGSLKKDLEIDQFNFFEFTYLKPNHSLFRFP